MNIRLVTLGPPTCYINEAPTDLAAQKLRFALLLYLALEKRAPREKVAALFWPERDEERARHTLSQNIYELRKLLGDEWLRPQTDPLEINDGFSVDIVEFQTLVEAGQLEAALNLYQGEFLSGFHVKGTNEFEAWVESKRRDLTRLHRRATRDHIAALVSQSDVTGALQYAQQWVDMDPLDDEANHALIDVLAHAGRRSEALAHFERYEKRIRTELDVAPLDETCALVERIRAATGVASGAPPVAEIVKRTAPQSGRARLFAELRNRKVMRTGGWYGATALVVIQAAQIIQEAFYLSPLWLTATVIVALVGFPIALFIAWEFELTPDGLRRHGRQVRTGLNRGWRIAGVATLFVSAASVGLLTAWNRNGLQAGGTATLVCKDGSVAPCRNKHALEPNRFVVLPLTHRGDAEPHLLNGELCARLITDGLSQWQDINIADQGRLSDALRRLKPQVRHELPVDTGFAVARSLGAGKLIMGELWQVGDTTRITASLYDVASGRTVKQFQEKFRSGSSDANVVFGRLAQAAVLENDGARVPVSIAIGTRSYAAVMAYDSAMRALGQWHLPEARKYLEIALRRDASFPHAHLWLAYTMLWQQDTTSAWKRHATKSRDLAMHFGVNERLLASGIALMAEHRFSAACEEFRELIRRDSTNFYGWEGLSECLAANERVVADAASPSGWAFEASAEEALRAQRRALSLVPSFVEAASDIRATRLAALTYLSSGKFRQGRSDDNAAFGAHAALEGDTLSTVPYPLAEWTRRAPPPSNVALMQRHRAIMQDVALNWAQAYPQNARALAALANALEATGDIRSVDSPNRSAIDAIRLAQKNETDAFRALRYRTAEVRMLVKIEDYRLARRRALDILKAHDQPTPREAKLLAGLAGLIGDRYRMAHFLAQSAADFSVDVPAGGDVVEPPIELARAAADYLAYAYFGGPRDSLAAAARRAHNVLNNRIAETERRALHAGTIDRAAMLAYPIAGLDDAHDAADPLSGLMRLQKAQAQNDMGALRAGLARLDTVQRNIPVTNIAMDGWLVQSQLTLAARDSARAVRMLDDFLGDLVHVPDMNFAQPYQPVSLVRMMALRAEIAAQKGDRKTARRWSRAVVDLWQDGDRDLGATLRRMRSYARL